MIERRRTKRKSLVSAIDIYSKDISGSIGRGFAIDLSEDGIKLVTSDSLRMDQELSFHFSLPNGWKFDFFGKIVHYEKAVSANAYGVKFLPGQSTFILRLV